MANMNITTIKHTPLLITFSFLTACSTQNTSVLGSQSSMRTQQSIPGSQLFQRRSNLCIDKTTGKAIPGCKSPTTVARPNNVKKLSSPPKTRTSSSKMRKALVVQPRQPRRVVQPTKLRRPTTPLRKPIVTQPYQAPIIANPVRSTLPATPVKPVKPKSTLRRLTLNGSTNFKSGSSRLTTAGQTELLTLALSLQEGNTKISRLLVEGHTDSVGNAAMNQVLSLKRANSVAEYLAKKGGFARSMMETIGLGESKPIASNKTKKGRALNRRVEITATGTRQVKR